MSKRTYKEAYGWLALGSVVLVIALGAALFYHHSTNQSERTPAQATERGGVGVVCEVDTWPDDERFERGVEASLAALNGKLGKAVRVFVSDALDRSFTMLKPFKVSAPTISTVKIKGQIRLIVCVTVSEE